MACYNLKGKTYQAGRISLFIFILIFTIPPLYLIPLKLHAYIIFAGYTL